MAWAEEQSRFGLEDLVLEAEEQRNLLDNQLWKTKDGIILPVSSMSTQHIRNSLRKISRDKWRTAYAVLLKAELQKRGFL